MNTNTTQEMKTTTQKQTEVKHTELSSISCQLEHPRVSIVRKRDGGRNWNNLPQGFELDAVRAAFQDIKGYFNKAEISNRIKASKSQTFTELYKYI